MVATLTQDLTPKSAAPIWVRVHCLYLSTHWRFQKTNLRQKYKLQFGNAIVQVPLVCYEFSVFILGPTKCHLFSFIEGSCCHWLSVDGKAVRQWTIIVVSQFCVGCCHFSVNSIFEVKVKIWVWLVVLVSLMHFPICFAAYTPAHCYWHSFIFCRISTISLELNAVVYCFK